jgi:transposase
MGAHTDSLVSRLEVVEVGRRRRWSDAEKLRIVAESMAGRRLVSATARRHGISRSQLYTWRRLAREGPGPGAGAGMIALPPGARVWLACGVTDMRRGMPGLALMVQEALGRDPHAGDLFVFRGKQGSLLKILWHDGVGMSLYARRLEKGRFIWPTPKNGSVAISAAQLAYMLDGIDWRNPRQTWRPQTAG